MSSSSLSWSSPSSSRSSTHAYVSNQTLARMLVIVVVTMVILNIVYLVPQFPKISIHENHYFFEEESHMYRGGNNHVDNDSDNANTHKFKNTTTMPASTILFIVTVLIEDTYKI